MASNNHRNNHYLCEGISVSYSHQSGTMSLCVHKKVSVCTVIQYENNFVLPKTNELTAPLQCNEQWRGHWKSWRERRHCRRHRLRGIRQWKHTSKKVIIQVLEQNSMQCQMRPLHNSGSFRAATRFPFRMWAVIINLRKNGTVLLLQKSVYKVSK